MGKNKYNCILLIDDDKITNYINVKLLNKLNIGDKIDVAHNGEEGISLIEQFCNLNDKCCPELIFLDINMPVMNGFEFLKVFNEMQISNKNCVHIIVLTTSSNERDIDIIKQYGLKVLNKPLTESKVKEALTEF